MQEKIRSLKCICIHFVYANVIGLVVMVTDCETIKHCATFKREIVLLDKRYNIILSCLKQ